MTALRSQLLFTTSGFGWCVWNDAACKVNIRLVLSEPTAWCPCASELAWEPLQSSSILDLEEDRSPIQHDEKLLKEAC